MRSLRAVADVALPFACLALVARRRRKEYRCLDAGARRVGEHARHRGAGYGDQRQLDGLADRVDRRMALAAEHLAMFRVDEMDFALELAFEQVFDDDPAERALPVRRAHDRDGRGHQQRSKIMVKRGHRGARSPEGRGSWHRRGDANGGALVLPSTLRTVRVAGAAPSSAPRATDPALYRPTERRDKQHRRADVARRFSVVPSDMIFRDNWRARIGSARLSTDRCRVMRLIAASALGLDLPQGAVANAVRYLCCGLRVRLRSPNLRGGST